jgi:hypothetical protein
VNGCRRDENDDGMCRQVQTSADKGVKEVKMQLGGNEETGSDRERRGDAHREQYGTCCQPTANCTHTAVHAAVHAVQWQSINTEDGINDDDHDQGIPKGNNTVGAVVESS